MKFAIIFALTVASFPAFAETSQLETDAKALVLAQLKDPQSAQFSVLKVEEATGFVCGSVNAKNGFGGYGEPMNFVVLQGNKLILGTVPQASVLIGSVCAEH